MGFRNAKGIYVEIKKEGEQLLVVEEQKEENDDIKDLDENIDIELKTTKEEKKSKKKKATKDKKEE